MLDKDNAGRIGASALAAELSDEQVRTLAAVAELHDLADGEVLIKRGDRDDRLFVVVTGALEVGLPSAQSGEWSTVVRLHPGDITGELAFLQDMERTATVRAAGKTTVVSLRRSNLESLLDTDPLLTYRVMRAILRSVHQVVSNMNSQHAHLINYIMG